MTLLPFADKLISENLYHGSIVEWEDLTSQLVDLLGSTQLSLLTLKRNSSSKLEHLLSAAIKVWTFLANDENEISTRSEFNNVQKYIVKSLSQMENNEIL